MSMMNHKIDPLNEERSVIDNLIASSQNLMGSTTENPVSQQCHTPSEYQMTVSKSKMMMKSRRGRTSFTPGQLSDLETAFANTHYPDFQTRKDLSNKLKIPDDRIQVWFQNRRAKWRKTQRQQNNRPTVMTSYHGHQMTGDAPSNPAQNQQHGPNEIILSYSTRPSPIRHTGSLVKSETINFNTCSVTQTTTTDSSTTNKQLQYQPNLGNGINIYEKNITAPHTSADIVMLENQRTAPHTSTTNIMMPENQRTAPHTSTTNIMMPENQRTAPHTSTTNIVTPENQRTAPHTSTTNIVTPENQRTAPHTSTTNIMMPENQRTAPSLYSLSAAVTSSGQYIILGPSNNMPTSYPMTVNCNNYPVVHIPSSNNY